jgi:Holliday junction resolvase RusA-like endonuclease
MKERSISHQQHSRYDDHRKIFDLKVSNLPVAWSRSRGERRRYKSESLREWQEFLREVAEEETTFTEMKWPYAGQVALSILIIFPCGRINRAPDIDNIAKGIIDALTGTLWPDDKPKYIRCMIIEACETEEKELVGTHLRVYAM